MKKFINGGSAAELTNQNLKYRINPRLVQDADCQDFSNESLQLKKMLKRAVEKEFAPQSLIDSIRKGIRR